MSHQHLGKSRMKVRKMSDRLKKEEREHKRVLKVCVLWRG